MITMLQKQHVLIERVTFCPSMYYNYHGFATKRRALMLLNNSIEQRKYTCTNTCLNQSNSTEH